MTRYDTAPCLLMSIVAAAACVARICVATLSSRVAAAVTLIYKTDLVSYIYFWFCRIP